MAVVGLGCIIMLGFILAGSAASPAALYAQESVQAEAGFRAFSYGSTATAPTAKDPQSKLWFNDGVWWGTLFNSTTTNFEIYRLDRVTQTWTGTGTVIDDRDVSRSDSLSDGTKLYVVTSGLTSTSSSNNARVRRFSYNAATRTYTLDSGFPVTLSTSGGMEAVGIEKDTTGKLWVTYTKNQSVYITHSTTSDSTWATPFVLPATESTGLLTQDESAIVSYNSKIGIMWGDQARTPMRYHFASHNDGDATNVWQSSTPLQGAEIADNHINLKGLDGDPAGQAFAVVKTSLNSPSDPLYYLLVLKNNGTWESHVFGTVADNHTRAQLVLDPQNRQLYAMAASPCCSGGAIYYKQTSLDSPSFSPGLGTPLLETSGDLNINNVSTTKQELSSATGLAVIASDDHTRFYVHNAFDLGPDESPPETYVDSGPSGVEEINTATFSFSANESGATFSCRLDGAAFSACTSPRTYSGLADGAHTFDVRATDPAGNTDATPATRAWTVDTNILTTTISPTADARVVVNTANTNFGSSAVLAADSSPNTESFLKFAVNVPAAITSAKLRLYATDATSNGPAAYSAVNAWTETAITWNNKPARTGQVLDDKAAIPLNTWVEYTVTPAVTGNGTYTFNVVPGSSDGIEFPSKESSNPNKPQLVIRYRGSDTTPPETTIDSGPSGTVSETAASFTFSSSESGSSFACSLDGAAFTACNSPQGYTDLADGSHTFAVRATDAAGNTDPTPASRSWTVDATSPQTTIGSGPSGTVSETTASFTFSASEGGSSFACSLDGAAFTACNSPQGYTDLADGSHTFQVRATDPAGNTDPTPASRSWTIDATPPQTTIDSGPSGTVSETAASFSFSASEGGSSFACSLDGAAFSACSSPQSYTNLAEGNHTFAVRATDAAGNTDPTPASRSWTVDLTAPTVTAFDPPDGASGVSTGTNVEATFSEPMDPATVTSATFTLAAPGSPAVAATVTYDSATMTAILNPDGQLLLATTYTATVVGGPTGPADVAGNRLAFDRTWSFTTDLLPDTTPPQTTIDSGPSGTTSETTASFTFSSSESGSSFACSLDGAAFTACNSPQGYTDLADGSHTFAVRATDAAGNTDPTPASRSWTVDATSPQTTIGSGPSGTVSETTASFTFSASEGGSSFACSLDGAAFTACNSPQGYTDLADGSHTFQVRATDPAGNTDPTPASRSWTIDATPPQTTIDSGPSGTVSETAASFTFSASEGGSSFACSLDGAAFSACSSPQGYTDLAEGSHTFQVRATDPAGNTDPTPASRSWTISLVFFSDGFESGSFSAWTSVLTGGDGTATVQSADVKTGGFAARLSETSATGSFAYARKQLDTARVDVTAKGDFKILTEGVSGGNVPIFRLFEPNGTRIISLYRQNLDSDKIRVTHSGVGVTTTGRLPLNTWGFFELHVITAGTGTSTVELKLDGQLVYQTTTASLGTVGTFNVQIGNETKAQPFALVADNISVTF